MSDDDPPAALTHESQNMIAWLSPGWAGCFALGGSSCGGGSVNAVEALAKTRLRSGWGLGPPNRGWAPPPPGWQEPRGNSSSSASGELYFGRCCCFHHCTVHTLNTPAPPCEWPGYTGGPVAGTREYWHCGVLADTPSPPLPHFLGQTSLCTTGGQTWGQTITWGGNVGLPHHATTSSWGMHWSQRTLIRQPMFYIGDFFASSVFSL